MPELTAEQSVAAALAMAGLSLSPAEAEALAETFAHSRAAVDALYRIPEVRYELPALTWSASL